MNKYTLAAVFAAAIVVANVTASKIVALSLPVLGDVLIPAGFVAMGIAFLATDLLGELHGREVAHAFVNGTIVALVIGWVLIYVSVLLPSAPFYDGGQFASVMQSSTNVVAAGVLTMAVSQHVDVSVFHYLRGRTDGDHRWLRNLGSTSISQFVDTVLFITLAFVALPLVLGGESYTLAVAANLVVGQYVAKLVIAALDTPVFYFVTEVTA